MNGSRRAWSLVAGALAIFGAIFPGRAASQVPVGGWMSPNVEWLGNVTLSGSPGAITGQLHGKYFYAEGLEAIEIFDVADPADPSRIGRIANAGPVGSPLGHPDIARAPVATNGRLLLNPHFYLPQDVPDSADVPEGRLDVYDISDKARPVLLGSLPGIGYAVECVADCRWAYGVSGEIVDLRDPTSPRLAGRWDEGLEFRPPPLNSVAFGVREVADDRVLIAGIPLYLLDVSRPGRPKVLARSDGSPYSQGSAVWPDIRHNRIVMSASQSFMAPRCEIQDLLRGTSIDSAFKTWDASDWRATGLIVGLSEYRLRNGTYADGNPAFSGASPLFWGCGTTEVDPHPRFRNGGVVAVTGSSHGVRFLDVDSSGGIQEAGWFLPYANDTFGAYWITDEIVYTVDWPRGIDILRFDANA